MTSLTLFKGVAFDGVNSFPYIPNQAVFDYYLLAKVQYSQDIHFNRIGEPILINKGYDTAIEYSYGCIDTDNKKYFIIPDSISVNENNRVYMTYSVDWYTTLMYGGVLAFGRAHLIKSTDVDPLTYSQSIQPNDMRISSHTPLDETPIGEIHVAYTTADDQSKVRWVLSKAKNGYSYFIENVMVVMPDNTVLTTAGHTLGVSEIMNGLLYHACGIPPANILGVFYVPYTSANSGYGGQYDAKYKDIDDRRYIWYELNDVISNPVFSRKHKDFNVTSNAMHSAHLIDRYGSIIYSVPYGRTLKRILFRPVLTASSCYIAIEFVYDTPPALADPSAVKSAENSFMLYMCEKIDFNNDAYANWASGLKGIEIEERRLQKNKALVSNLTNVGTTAALGMGAGGPAGAAAGATAGFAGAIASYAIDTYYESGVNRLEDRKYQLTQDTMVPGGFLPGLSPSVDGLSPTLAIVVLSAPPSDIARYEAELSNYGADCNIPVSSWTPSVGAYKFADVEVIADVPYSIKQNIKQKMQSGIKIVGLN